MKYKIAVLLTCFNRRDKTSTALRGLIDIIHNFTLHDLDIHIFLTDDGCTDDTANAAKSAVGDIPLTIIKSDGSAFWAGGMRLAWSTAIDTNISFDFFLLINDDTVFKPNCFEELFNAHFYATEQYGIGGVYSGFISSVKDENIITYGAKEYSKSFFSKAVALRPTGKPQICSMVNANILLVTSNVVESIGILDNVFIHAAADMDYGLRAKSAGFPVLTTANVCGYCEYDHDGSDEERLKVMNLTLKERKKYLDRPNIKQYHDSIEFYRRYDKLRFVIFKLSYYLNLYFPSLYYSIYKRRGH